MRLLYIYIYIYIYSNRIGELTVTKQNYIYIYSNT